MSLVKNIKIGNVSYTIRDANTNRSLDETQKVTALNEGTYDGVAIEDGEVFTEYDGKFVEFKNEPTEGKPPVQVTQPIAGSVFGHGGRVIIWSRSGTTGYYSDNSGSTWNTFTIPFTEATKFAHNGSLWMAASSFYTATSSDGITWSQGAGFPSQYASYLGSFDGKFYTYYTDSYWFTEDGASWTKGTSPVSGSIVLLCRDEDVLLFAENGGIYKSTDGVSWENTGKNVGFSMGTYAKAYYVLGKTWASSGYKAYSEGDLSVWTRSSPAAIDSYVSIVEVNKTLAISVDQSSLSKSQFYTSTEGISWTTITTPSSFTYSRVAATSDGTFYVFQQRSTTGFVGKAGTSYSFNDLSYTKEEVDAAVAGVDLTGYLQNTATGSNSLSIEGNSGSYTYALSAGKGSYISGNSGTAVGSLANAGSNGTALGNSASAGNTGTAIGSNSGATKSYSIALGMQAQATAERAIQIGYGNNTEASSVYVGYSSAANYKLLDADGTIPAERISNSLTNYQEKLSSGNGIVVTQDENNFEYVGDTVKVSEEKVATDFTAQTSYLTATNPLFDINTIGEHTSFDMVVCFMANVSTNSGTFLNTTPSGSTTPFGIRVTGGKLACACFGRGSITGTTELQLGEKIYAKISYVKDVGYTLYYSSNGKTWTQEASLTSNTQPPVALSDLLEIGKIASGGSIYLTETYINVDGVRVWTAATLPGLGLDKPTQIETTAPTTETIGSIGQIYVDTATGTGYMCVNATGGSYTWKQITASA